MASWLEWSRFEPWLGMLHCVLRKDSRSGHLFPPNGLPVHFTPRGIVPYMGPYVDEVIKINRVGKITVISLK